MSEIPKAVESKKSVEKNNLPWEKEIIKDTQERTDTLKKWETEFEKLEKNEKYSEELRELMSSLSWYIDTKLWNWFNKIQKDNIKLVFLDKVSQDINSGWLNNISSTIQKTLNNIASIFSKEKNKWKEDNNVKNKLANFKNEFSNLWLDRYMNDLDEKIENLKEEKNKKQFNKLATAFSALWIKKKYLNDIKEDLFKTSKTFEQFWESASIIQKGADKLWMWDMLKDFISSLKDIPIIWPFLMMFFKWFEKNNWTNKKQKSISNLQTFLENKEKSHLDKIEENNNFKNKEKLNPEKLKSFYEYLDTKNIDYSKDTFWEEFLNWKSKNPKIIELNKLLNSTQDKKLKWTQLKDISLEKFIETLNNLWKIEDKKEKEEIIKHNTSIKTKIEKAKKEWKTQEVKNLEKQIKHTFEENLANNKIEVNWKLENISIVNNQIKIWENLYNISIMWNIVFMKKEFFESISLNNGIITIKANWEIKNYNANQAKPILKSLINNWNYSQKIPWKPATLIITKA